MSGPLHGYRIVDLARYMLRTVDLVVQVMKVGGGLRRVTEIWEPPTGGEPVKLYERALDHD